MTGDKYHIAPSMETSDQYSYLHAELKACRLQLQQAARRVSAALQAKDALEVKLDTAVTNQRELSNQLEAANKQNTSLAGEVTNKANVLIKTERRKNDAEARLSSARLEISRMKEKLCDVQSQLDAERKIVHALKESLQGEQEQCGTLQRTMEATKQQLTSASCALIKAEEACKDLRKEVEVRHAQGRRSEQALLAAEEKLRVLRAEAEEQGRVRQATKVEKDRVQEMMTELTHAGIELLREQRKNEHRKNSLATAHSSGDEIARPQTDRYVSELQRRLIKQEEKIVGLQRLVEERTKEIDTLKRSLEIRRDGDELQNELIVIKDRMNQKDRKLRAASAERRLASENVN